MTSALLIVAMLFGSPAMAKPRDWKEAKIIEGRYQQKHDHTDAAPRRGGAPTRTLIDAWTYVVELDGIHYELEEQNPQATFTAGQTMKFAIEKKEWYFLDAKGKEKKGDVIARKDLKP